MQPVFFYNFYGILCNITLSCFSWFASILVLSTCKMHYFCTNSKWQMFTLMFEPVCYILIFDSSQFCVNKIKTPQYMIIPNSKFIVKCLCNLDPDFYWKHKTEFYVHLLIIKHYIIIWSSNGVAAIFTVPERASHVWFEWRGDLARVRFR